MNRRIAFPFNRLSDDTVGFKGWFIGDPGEPLLPAHDTLGGWDYERDLEVRTGFELDFRRVPEILGCPTGDLKLTAVLKG